MKEALVALKFFYSNGGEFFIGIQTILAGLIAVALLIPGPQPERFLQKILNFLEKFSKK